MRLRHPGVLAAVLICLVLFWLLRGNPLGSGSLLHDSRSGASAAAEAGTDGSGSISNSDEGASLPTFPAVELATSVPVSAAMNSADEENRDGTPSDNSNAAEIPLIETGIPGARFYVHFDGYRPPPVPDAEYWRIVAFRDMLSGCRVVQAAPIGGPISPLIYRTFLPIKEEEGATNSLAAAEGATELSDDPQEHVSLAVFLAAVPYDRDGILIPGVVEVYGGEVHFSLRDIQSDPNVYLTRATSASEFRVTLFPPPPSEKTVESKTDPKVPAPATTAREKTYFGNIRHVARLLARGAWDIRTRDLVTPFPMRPEPFLDERDQLSFTAVPFELVADVENEIRFFNWPQGFTFPSSVRYETPSDGFLHFAEPKEFEVRFSNADSGVIPRHLSRLEYLPAPAPLLPPIEIRGVQVTDGVVRVENSWFSATAKYSIAGGRWKWQVLSHGPVPEGMTFRAQLFAPGIEPSSGRGKVGSTKPVRLIANRSRQSERLAGDVWVDAEQRFRVPLLGTLTVTWEGRSVTDTVRLATTDGRYSLEIDRRFKPATLEVEIDLPLWTSQLRQRYFARWGQELEPIWIEAELVAESRENGRVQRQRYEVTVRSDQESWWIAEFFDRFDL